MSNSTYSPDSNQPKTAAIYARVSSNDQGKDYSLDTQIDGCLALVNERGDMLVADPFREAGKLRWEGLDGFWSDAGTFDSLFHASRYWVEKAGPAISKT